MKRARVVLFFQTACFFAVVIMLLGGGSLVFSSDHHEHGCPLMVGETSVCKMEPLQYASMWESMTKAVIPLIIFFLCIIVFVSRDQRIELFVPHDPPPLPRVFVSLLQPLFARGILHSKVP